jgi:hypothetical protein
VSELERSAMKILAITSRLPDGRWNFNLIDYDVPYETKPSRAHVAYLSESMARQLIEHCGIPDIHGNFANYESAIHEAAKDGEIQERPMMDRK